MLAPEAVVVERIDRVEAQILAERGRVATSPVRRDDLVDPLSDRELTVLRCLAGSQDSTEIADSLYLSVNTVRSHVKAIYRKLSLASGRNWKTRAWSTATSSRRT